jgi:hypothetical protein
LVVVGVSRPQLERELPKNPWFLRFNGGRSRGKFDYQRYLMLSGIATGGLPDERKRKLLECIPPNVFLRMTCTRPPAPAGGFVEEDVPWTFSSA